MVGRRPLHAQAGVGQCRGQIGGSRATQSITLPICQMPVSRQARDTPSRPPSIMAKTTRASRAARAHSCARSGSCWLPQKPVSGSRPLARHAVGIRGAPLRAGAHAFAGQVSRATVRRAQAGQHAGQEGAVFLQDFVGRDVGRGQAALVTANCVRGKRGATSPRAHRPGRHVRSAGPAPVRTAWRCARREPADRYRRSIRSAAAGRRARRGRALDRGFVEAASARMAKQRQHARALTGWLRWRAPRVPRPGPGDARSR